jgi:hypothetical protein
MQSRPGALDNEAPLTVGHGVVEVNQKGSARQSDGPAREPK